MTFLELIAKSEHRIRPIIGKLPPDIVAAIYSSSRKVFLKSLVNSPPNSIYSHSINERIKIWELTFSCSLFNAAGMFKNGDGYYLSAKQGAGAYLAGTTTFSKRTGNEKNGVWHPFMPYPSSYSASNWLGLPNEGHNTVAKKLSLIEKFPHCPIGASLAASPDKSGVESLKEIVSGMEIYNKANVDFLEINESCPNVPHESSANNSLDSNFINRLEYISNRFLKKRNRNLPVIVKLSNDTQPGLIVGLIGICYDLGFDGINFGNTSTDYDECQAYISVSDLKNYKYFTKTFGGGVSGLPLKNKSLNLCARAMTVIKSKDLNREFHIIRTGGVHSREDILQSKEKGIKLNQWFTGYFDAFSKFGNRLYKHLFR